MRLSASETIDRSAAEVFRFVATEHWQNHPKWDPAIVELTPTTAGRIGAGAKARLVRVDRGRRSEGTVEVVAFELDRRFEAVSRFGPFFLTQRATLTPLDDRRTRIDLVIDSMASGVFGPMLWLMRPRFRKTMASSLHTIKQEVERMSPPLNSV
jgi:Polyketide cyclase / dehydrase and lipid transport